VSLSLQITHEAFFAPPNLFLTIILQLPIPKSRLNSVPSLSTGRLGSRIRLLSRLLLLHTVELFLITTLHGPRRRHDLYCSESLFNNPLSSNGRPIVARVRLCGNVFTKSLPSNEFIRHNTYINTCTEIDDTLKINFLYSGGLKRVNASESREKSFQYQDTIS
jgi:hypothetical protein